MDEHTLQEYVSVSAAARSLNVCNETIYRMLRRGEIPGAIRVGKSVRLPRQWLQSFREYYPDETEGDE